MWIEEHYGDLKPRARAALKTALEVNKNRTVPVRINSYTLVYVTPEQSADPKFMKRFLKKWEAR